VLFNNTAVLHNHGRAISERRIEKLVIVTYLELLCWYDWRDWENPRRSWDII